MFAVLPVRRASGRINSKHKMYLLSKLCGCGEQDIKSRWNNVYLIIAASVTIDNLLNLIRYSSMVGIL